LSWRFSSLHFQVTCIKYTNEYVQLSLVG